MVLSVNKDLKNCLVGVLGGGISAEREISLLSAQQAKKALENKNIKTVFIDITTSDKEKVKKLISSYNIDIAFIALHGEFGEDGQIQKILEEMAIPYTGSGPKASLYAMDKILSKEFFIRYNVITPKYVVYKKKDNLPEIKKFPVVVKPHFSGSSLGVSIAADKVSLLKAIENAFSYQDKIIIEEYIEGCEFTVGILEDKPLGVVQIIPKTDYFDFKTKYTDGLAEFIAPAKIEDSLYKKLQEVAICAHRALGCRHFSRVDIRMDKYNTAYVLEVNSIPGLTSHSLLPLSASCCNISFDDLIFRMLELAWYEKKVNNKN
ncbi:MAG: D-alanine--D-alanine ligase [Candidatus Omnitrophica bacterium]|nr:D-alanine--D-alanine ligase [Candidatus Omnitrophota bacterium]